MPERLQLRRDGSLDESVALAVNTYDQAHFLDESLRSALVQSRPFDEIIVVDDGSNDDPASVAARHRGVRLVRQPNAGLAAARNTGLRRARASSSFSMPTIS